MSKIAKFAAVVHKATHVSGGTDAFDPTDVLEAAARRLAETGGPTILTLGAVADGKFLKRVGSNIVGVDGTGGGAGNGSVAFACVFRDDGKAYYEFGDSSWEALGALAYPGSLVMGVSEIKLVVARSDSDGDVRVRLRDVTNNNTLVMVTWSTASQHIETASSFSDVPTGEAILEVQAKKNGDNGRIYSFLIR